MGNSQFTGRLAAVAAIAALCALPLRAATAADAIPEPEFGGPTTTELKGLHIHYLYETGREYDLDFDSETVTFIQYRETGGVALAKPSEPGVMHYRARKLRDQLYLVHWINRSPEMGNIHVALVIDLREHLLHASAMMPRGLEMMNYAHIKEIDWKGHGMRWKAKG